MKPLTVEQNSWEGRAYTCELYKAVDLAGISPIRQIQAVCFDENSNIVLYHHKKGWNGLPGGHVEETDKDLAETLRREISEEIGGDLQECGVLGYEKIWWNDNPDDIFYFARYWAVVTLIAAGPNDPDGKALERIVCTREEALEKLGYGEKGEVLLQLAFSKVKV